MAGGTLSDDPKANSAVAAVRPKVPFPSCRTVFILMSFFGLVNIYCLRVNLSVALVAMVNSTYIEQLQLEEKLQDLESNKTLVQERTCGQDTNLTAKVKKPMGEFEWDAHKQGTVLAAFFYGYITTQLLGGILAQKIGSKILLLGGIGWTAVLTVLTPPLTSWGDFPAIVATRVLEGIGEGVTYPAMHAMISKWAPPLERSKFVTIIYAGAPWGTVVAMIISGLLAEYVNWGSVFYVFGALGIVWSILWIFLAYDTPTKHPRISPAERDYIDTSIGTSAKKPKHSLKVPWGKILTSLPVYAIIVGHFTNNWGYYTLLTCLPLYMKHILHFDLKSNGFLSGVPYIFMWLCLTLSGVIADLLRSRNLLSTTNVRKLLTSIGFIGPAICLVATGYVECDAGVAVFLIVLAVGLSGISMGGWFVNHLDLAPPFAGTLMGITNMIATIPGFLGPTVVGALTNRNQTRQAWRNVFFVTAAIYVFGTLFYLIFGTGVRQPWGTIPDEVEEKNGEEKDGKKSPVGAELPLLTDGGKKEGGQRV